MFGLHYLRSPKVRSTLFILHSCASYVMLSATSSFQLIQSFTAEFILVSTLSQFTQNLSNGTPLAVAADLKSTASLFLS